ncbi:MAG: cytidylate kinase family protein [Desulfarculus sp.]|nr:cytidylate kinase family protein [Desulfarculus sp.]
MGIVTISRQVGSFGDEIAALAARKLGYEHIDREHVHRLAQGCDDQFRQACLAYESETKPHGFFERLAFSNPAHAALFASLNYELAKKGDVVMVGRGAQVVLGHLPGVLKVRVVAPSEVRVERVARRMNLSLEDAREFVRKFDHERRVLLEAVFEYDLFDWKNFDLVINTAALTVEDAADMIVLAAERLAPRYDQAKMAAVLGNLAFAKRVESAVKKQVETLYSQDIVVTADDQGVVVLRGLVSDPRSKALAGEAAAKVQGVTRVVNNLTTTQYSV